MSLPYPVKLLHRPPLTRHIPVVVCFRKHLRNVNEAADDNDANYQLCVTSCLHSPLLKGNLIARIFETMRQIWLKYLTFAATKG